MFHVLDAYPPDAVNGADFFSGAVQRKLVEGESTRLERIVVCDREITYDDAFEGRIAMSEQTVREMGALVGLVDSASVEVIRRENRELRRENGHLSGEVADLRAAVTARATATAEVYVTPDGVKHATEGAAKRHMNPDPPLLVPAAPLTEAP